MNIRPAEPGDLEAWAAMRGELWPDSRDDHPGEPAEYFAGHSIDIAETLIAESNAGEITGFIELNIRDFAEGSRSPKAHIGRNNRRALGPTHADPPIPC